MMMKSEMQLYAIKSMHLIVITLSKKSKQFLERMVVVLPVSNNKDNIGKSLKMISLKANAV